MENILLKSEVEKLSVTEFQRYLEYTVIPTIQKLENKELIEEIYNTVSRKGDIYIRIFSKILASEDLCMAVITYDKLEKMVFDKYFA